MERYQGGILFLKAQATKKMPEYNKLKKKKGGWGGGDGPGSKSKQVHGACQNKEADFVLNCKINSQPTLLLMIETDKAIFGK